MKEFAELSRIVTKNRAKKIDILFDDSSTSGEKYRNLAEAITENPDLSEEEAEGIIGSSKQSSAYRMFKSRFREKLLNNILISDLDLISTYSRASVLLSRNVYCIRVLLIISARESAVDLAEQTLKKAVEFQLWDIAMYCSMTLCRHQRYIVDLDKFEYYRDQYDQFDKIRQAESKAILFYEYLQLIGSNTLSFDKEKFQNFWKDLEDIKALKEKYDTYQLGLFYYRSLSSISFDIQDYQASVDALNQMAEFIKSYKNFEYESRLGEILIFKMHRFLYMHDFDNGMICAQECKKIFKPGANNWFVFNELIFVISVHTHNYEQAGKILESVSSAKQFKFQISTNKERWRIFEAYYFILLKAGKATHHMNARFRFSSFLNSINIYNKDKKGYNASILIADILYHLLNREFHIITEKIESIQRYSKRYYEENENYRSNIFLKMLIECDKCGYVKEEVLKKTKKLFQKLETTQYSYVSNLDGIEIVPFVDLWDIVCNCLD